MHLKQIVQTIGSKLQSCNDDWPPNSTDSLIRQHLDSGIGSEKANMHHSARKSQSML